MSWTETYRQGKNIASLGIYMTVSGFVTTLYSYLFVAWLNDRGGTGEVGFSKRVIRWSCSMWVWFYGYVYGILSPFIGCLRG